mgnify:FL=1
MDNIIMQAITLAVMVGAFILGKYVFPNVPKSVTTKLNDLAAWASKFVVWAREFMQSSTGEEKMEKVVEQLKQIADEAGLNITEDQLRAIAQAAYEAMKAGEAAQASQGADNQATPSVPVQQAAAPAATVIVNTGGPAEVTKVAIATDQVPDGALDDNPDGTVKVYNDAGEKIGTMDKAQAEEAATDVDVVVEAPEEAGEDTPAPAQEGDTQ